MRVIKADLPETFRNIELHTFADLHIGDANCDLTAIKSNIEAVAKKPNAYAILNGDLMNNATKTSVSDSYAEAIPPMEQIQMCVDLFEPIKNKILFITGGNHEKRTYNKEGIDISNLMSRQLGLFDKFCPNGGVLFIRVGKTSGRRHYVRQTYSISIIHGSGGGRKEGAKAVRLADMASIVDTDIYIHSHTHLPMVMKQSFFRSYASNGTVTPIDKLFVNTSSMLNYGGYGQQFEFKPNSMATPIIYLDGTKRRMEAKL